MTSSPTPILRFELQGAQEHTGTWRVNLNAVIDRWDEAIAGFLDVATTGGDTALTEVNYNVDQARYAYVRIGNGQTLASNVRVTTGTPRLYFVHNATSAGAFTVKFGGDNSNLATISRGFGQFILVRSDNTIVPCSPLIDSDGDIDEAVFGTISAMLPVATEDFAVAVEDTSLSGPPGTASPGTLRYIVKGTRYQSGAATSSTATGAWTGKEDHIASITDGVGPWSFIAPVNGMLAFDKTSHNVMTYSTSGGWHAAVAATMYPAGTAKVFQQAAPPAGWTQRTTISNSMLRVVSGVPSLVQQGTNPLTTVFGLTATDGRVLTQGMLPDIDFTYEANDGVDEFLTNVTPTLGESINSPGNSPPGSFPIAALNKTYSPTVVNVASGGSGTSHAHDIDMRVKYVDALIATLN